MNNNDSALRKNARELRKNMTKEERRLWYGFLKELPTNVNRQKVLGRYIVDFYIASAGVVIELDGSQHFEEAGLWYDAERDAYLRGLGLTVLRYTNSDINGSFTHICESILTNIKN